MKKQYIKPVTESYKVETEQMMAASPTGVSFNDDAMGNGLLNNEKATQNGSALSKGHGFDLWADDEY